MAHNCEFCGEYSGKYPLCRECFKLMESGELEQCTNCGEWHYTWEYCECEQETATCIICNSNKENDGYLFCKTCYHQYKNKTITLQIKNCRNIKLIDSYYDGRYKCKDGHIVKSKAEREIDNYLFDHNIKHCYEKNLAIDNNKEHDLLPDFYLPEENVYIEHLGKEEDPSYIEILQYKMKIYKKLGLTIVCTHESTDSFDMESALNRKLKNYKAKKINYYEEK